MGFIDRLSNAWNIFAVSMDFVKRDKSLVVVPVLMLLSGIVFCVLFAVLSVLSESPLQRYMAATVVIFLLIANVWSTFLGAMQSWMVHEVAQGKDATVGSGFKRAMHNFGDIIAYAFVFLVVSILIGAIRKQGRIGEFAAGWLSTFAGIIGKLILPAMIVTERSFADAVRQLKESTKAIPEIATFEVGIRPLTGAVFFVGALLSVATGFIFGLVSGIVLMVIFVIFIILFSLFINNTYYTLLYLTLIEKKHVPGLKLK